MALLLDGLANGWISLFAILVLWVETAVLSLLAAQRWRRFRALCANALSGTFLLSALGLALRGQGPIWILALLAASLVAHAADILMRGQDKGRLFKRNTE
jgi:CHASE2 domain-containing sensor protein